MDFVRTLLSDATFIEFNKVESLEFEIKKSDIEFDPIYRFSEKYIQILQGVTKSIEQIKQKKMKREIKPVMSK